jgi:arylsulfatase A-like enzyme
MRDDTRPPRTRHPSVVVLAGILFATAVAACSNEDAGRTQDAAPNLVVFVFDAARADHFGSYGYARETTPRFDAFARQAARFEQAISDGSFTFASVSALFTGLPPDRTGLLKARKLRMNLPLLAEAAVEAGYRTRGYSENPYVTSHFGFDRGFDSFETTLDYGDWKRDTRDFAHSDSAPGIDALLDFMGEVDAPPFFVYAHVLRPHNPFTPPEDFAGRFGSHSRDRDGSTRVLFAIDKQRRRIAPQRLANIRALYDENLAAADAAFGRLLDGLAARGLLEDTVVVALADHGEGFLEHGRLLHGSTPFEEMIRIPLAIRVPGASPTVVAAPVQLGELGARLRELLDGSLPARELVARLADGAPETLSWAMLHEHRVSVRTPSRKLVVDTERFEPVGYYDLEADPDEQRSLPLEDLDDEGERLLALALARIRAGHASLARPPESEIDPEVLEQIRALGYVED